MVKNASIAHWIIQNFRLPNKFSVNISVTFLTNGQLTPTEQFRENDGGEIAI